MSLIFSLDDEERLSQHLEVRPHSQAWPSGESHPALGLVLHGARDGPRVDGVVAVEVGHGEEELGRDGVGEVQDGSGQRWGDGLGLVVGKTGGGMIIELRPFSFVRR